MSALVTLARRVPAVLLVLFVVVVPLARARAQACEPGQGSACADASSDASPDAPREGFLFRSILDAGYAHFLYLTSERDGGGPVLGASVTFAYLTRDGLFVGGSVGFEPILTASGETGVTSGRAAWGPLFTPRGHVGVTLGYASGIVEIDATIGVGGGGNRQMGGFGLVVVPTLALSFFDSAELHFGVALRPSFSVLYDFGSDRPLVDLGVTAGLSFSYR